MRRRPGGRAVPFFQMVSALVVGFGTADFKEHLASDRKLSRNAFTVEVDSAGPARGTSPISPHYVRLSENKEVVTDHADGFDWRSNGCHQGNYNSSENYLPVKLNSQS